MVRSPIFRPMYKLGVGEPAEWLSIAAGGVRWLLVDEGLLIRDQVVKLDTQALHEKRRQ